MEHMGSLFQASSRRKDGIRCTVVQLCEMASFGSLKVVLEADTYLKMKDHDIA
jgi:hypothetical protein